MTAQLQHTANDITASIALNAPALEVDFHSFYAEMEKLPNHAVDKIIPVHVMDDAGNTSSVADIASNWYEHSAPYLKALEWFENLYKELQEDMAEFFAETLTLEQQAIIQIGYQIRYEGHYAPRLDRQLYYVVFALASDPNEPTNFPVVRFRPNPKISLSAFEIDQGGEYA